jgi:drug/metabolite transporter (DMT)-like permease
VERSDAQHRAPLLLAALAVLAFAGNSLLCRLALRPGWIDATSFALIRIASGAATLLLLSTVRIGMRKTMQRGSWMSAIALAAYAAPFALAYVDLDAGTGALVLFGAVQITMITAGIAGGERPPLRFWLGFAAAIAGLVVLLLPGATAPSLAGLLWMTVAGVSWGVYSLRGRSADDPCATTAANFVLATPICVALSACCAASTPVVMEPSGVLVAALSGVIPSGLGYVVWYAAVGRLPRTTAALAQLTVPILAACGGIAWFSEPVTLRLCAAALLTLGGAAIVLQRRR